MVFPLVTIPHSVAACTLCESLMKWDGQASCSRVASVLLFTPLCDSEKQYLFGNTAGLSFATGYVFITTSMSAKCRVASRSRRHDAIDYLRKPSGYSTPVWGIHVEFSKLTDRLDCSGCGSFLPRATTVLRKHYKRQTDMEGLFDRGLVFKMIVRSFRTTNEVCRYSSCEEKRCLATSAVSNRSVAERGEAKVSSGERWTSQACQERFGRFGLTSVIPDAKA